MPIASVPITGRREAGNAISSEFGGKGCSTHSPSPKRPGILSKCLSRGFEKLGYRLVTKVTGKAASGNLIEVYPHPALLKLLGDNYRIPYKVVKSNRYWPTASIAMRKEKLLAQHARILSNLQQEIACIELELPDLHDVKSLSSLKPYEDALDSLLCAWVGIKYLQGEATPYGDDTAAIWVPK
jgi:predicted RNase H-like nuclease